MRGVNAGDEDAFATLYFRYRDWVARLALRLTGNDADALDVLQETFSYLLRKVPHLRLDGRLTTLLYPVVKNLSIAANRKRRRLTSPSSDNILAHLPSPAAPESPHHDLLTLLGALPEPHREVLLLRFLHDLQLNEIASALDIPLGTVKSRLHNALNTLRADPRVQKFFEP